MTDPTTTSAAAFAAMLSGVTLAMLGVDYYSLLYGMVGAFLALGSTETAGRGKAVAYVCMSTLVGAVVGNAALAFMPESMQVRQVLILGCLVGGYGAHLIAKAVLDAVLRRINKFGGPDQ